MAKALVLKNIETLIDIRIFGTMFLYDMLQLCQGIEAKWLFDQINSILIGSNIYWKKKTWEVVAMKKDDFLSCLQFAEYKE